MRWKSQTIDSYQTKKKRRAKNDQRKPTTEIFIGNHFLFVFLFIDLETWIIAPIIAQYSAH